MSDSINKLVDTLIKAIDQRQTKKTKGYSTQAEVLRVQNGTAWVHIPGGADETPVQETVACKKGDTVQVRVEGGKATLTGNQSAPPTDDTKADKAQETADDAAEVAEEAKAEAEGTSQYFWYMNGSTSEAGAHVTEVPASSFRQKPSGGNLIMRSNSMKIRNALTVLSEFDGNGMYVYAGGNKVAEFKGTEANITNASGYKLQLKGGDINFIPTSGVGAVIDFLAGHYIKMRYSDPGSPSEVKCEYGQVTVTGDLITPDKASFGSLDNGIFEVTTEPVFASTSINGGAQKYNTVALSKPNYYPLGVVGWNSPDTSAFVPARLRLSAQAAGSGTLSYSVRNVASTAQTGEFKADILWLKVA